MSFEDFWNAWPKSIRKGAKSQCKAKWDKLALDMQTETIINHVKYMKTTEQWKRADGKYIPAPLVYLNQLRWDGAEIPDDTQVVVNIKDPALAKIEADRQRATAMPDNIRQKLRDLTKQFKAI